MKFKFLSFIAVAAMLSSVGMSAANSYGIPDKIQDGNILHCFDWTFNDIIKELPAIAEAGFGAIQVSPVQGNANTNAEWFYAYMPYDFKFKANGNGSRQQLEKLCTEADKYGIKIVVDVVANHINQASGYHDSWWDSNGRIRWNGRVDYGNRYSITHNQLGEYGDVNSEDSQVQARCKEFLEDLKSIGVDGIRWDAAKHIGLPSEGCQFWAQMASVAGLWHYGEILDGPGGDKYTLLKEYAKYIGVTDSEYSKWTINQVMGGNVPTGGGSWTANGVPANAVVLWGESHDDYSNDGQYGWNSSQTSQDKIDRAYAIVACRNSEAALYFSRPSATSRSAIKMGQKGSTHFTSKEIAEVNKFRNAMVGKADYYSQQGGVACITRQQGGAVIVVGSGGSRQVSVSNGGGYCPAGTYTDHVSGNTFTVTGNTISGQVGSTGIAVIYGEVSHDASVTFSPNGGEFTNTVSVTATAVNASSAWYKIGNGSEQTLSGSKTFTLGSDMKVGESVTVSWSATGESGTKSGSVVFKKVDKPQNAYVYFENTSNWNVKVWAWNESGDCCRATAWPGDDMTPKDGKLYWEAPDGKVPTMIIFSDNGGAKAGGGDLQFVNGATYKPDGTYTTGGNPDPNPNPNPNPDPSVEMPAKLYVLGNLEIGSWTPSKGVEMTREGNTFTAYSISFVAVDDNEYCYFNLTDALGADWDALNAAANRWGAAEKDTPLTLNTPLTMTAYRNGDNVSACHSWQIEPGKYNVIADFKANTVTLKVPTVNGIDKLEADDTPAEYYNLQGLRVVNPGSGVYIKVQGGKATKVRM